ncbi:MAG TPA: DUF1257 domain-containing protein, partial [Vicinamibacteria bacterium]|nr:DUF1257 domain-containing protein [Vicinamibacteria bacterium]
MSQVVEVGIVIEGMAALVKAIAEAGLQARREKSFRSEDGAVHAVDLVVTDESGTQVGVAVEQNTGRARFVTREKDPRRGTALANRVAQRYAYSKITQELRRKGYQIAKEEKQQDGTIKLVA